MLDYLSDEHVREYHADADAPRYGWTASGYGSKIPTRYRLTLSDGRTRRVYVVQYGNIGSTYAVVGGRRVYLSSDVEHFLAATVAS